MTKTEIMYRITDTFGKPASPLPKKCKMLGVRVFSDRTILIDGSNKCQRIEYSTKDKLATILYEIGTDKDRIDLLMSKNVSQKIVDDYQKIKKDC